MELPQKSGNITAAVENIAKPLAQKLELDIWDIKFLKEGPNWYLRVFIDKPAGITLEDCENMSRALDEPLDTLDPISQPYCLEVCSPGIERELVNEKHFQQFKGSEIKIRLVRPESSGKKDLAGKFISWDKDTVEIKNSENSSLLVNRKNIARINLKS